MEPPSIDVVVGVPAALDEYCGLLLNEDFNCVEGFRCDMGGYGAVGGMIRRESGPFGAADGDGDWDMAIVASSIGS